jgi:hypothetical protein
MPAEERFWASAKREGECLIWQKSCRANGYGQLKTGGRNRTAHTVAYELANGPIPTGMQVDHRCRRRACIEPAHLRLATQKQNAENRNDHPDTVSGVRGVAWDKARKRWHATVTHNYRSIFLGRFSDLAEAERVVVAARQAIFTHS